MNARSHLAVILAGGKSQRMGTQDKAELIIKPAKSGPYRLIDQVFAQISAQLDRVWISGPTDYGLGVLNLSDHPQGPQGPVAGIYTVWRSLTEADAGEALNEALDRSVMGFFSVPVDGPELPTELCARLYSPDHSSIVRGPDGVHPSLAWWRINDLSRAFKHMDLKGSVSLKSLAHHAHAEEIFWPNLLLFNINTPNDFALYLTEKSQGDM